MNEASSDAMKTIALASSSERPRRPIGTPVTRAALFSGVPVNRVNMPVSVGPGATAFTRIVVAAKEREGGAPDAGVDVHEQDSPIIARPVHVRGHERVP